MDEVRVHCLLSVQLLTEDQVQDQSSPQNKAGQVSAAGSHIVRPLMRTCKMMGAMSCVSAIDCLA